MSDSPSIILKTKFETGIGNKNNIKELDKFIDYITRQEAIEKKEQGHIYTTQELAELKRIEKGLEKMFDTTESPIIEDIGQLDRYVDYMTRKKAILDNEESEIVSGAFSSFNRYVTKENISEIKNNIIEAKENKSVMYQDVISFNNDFLVEEGYYNPETKQLDEDSMYKAVKKMMDTCIEKEDLKEAFWFGAIHRNTENIHIHVTLMEKTNTRKLVEYDGVLQAKGVRKDSTLEEMKLSVGRTLLNREKEFSVISDIRKDLPKEQGQEIRNLLRDIYISKNKKDDKRGIYLEKKFDELKKEIPSNTKGYNTLPEKTKMKIDEVTTFLTKDNPMKKEYLDTAKKIDELYQKTYGDSYKKNEYYLERENVLKQRLGNALVREVKSLKSEEMLDNPPNFKKSCRKKNEGVDNNLKKFKTERGKEKYQKYLQSLSERRLEQEQREIAYQKKIDHMKDRRDFRKVKKELQNDTNLYRAEKQYEEVQRKIQQEQIMRERGYEI